jgi:hypothetical protein
LVNGLSRKLGPLKLWQWIAIGAALGGAIYLYRKNQQPAGVSNEEIFGGTGTGAYGPINPDTGIPYAFEQGLGGSAGAEGFGEFLEKVAQIKELFVPETEPGESAGETAPATKGGKANAAAKKARAAAKKAKKEQQREHKKRVQAEHQHTQKPGTTGGAASAPHTHHSPPPPHTHVSGARVAGHDQAHVGAGAAAPAGAKPHARPARSAQPVGAARHPRR